MPKVKIDSAYELLNQFTGEENESIMRSSAMSSIANDINCNYIQKMLEKSS
jgi:hypothetical protein